MAMLGKGLESLIPPQKGNQGNSQNSRALNGAAPDEALLPAAPHEDALPAAPEPAAPLPVVLPMQPTASQVPATPTPSPVSAPRQEKDSLKKVFASAAESSFGKKEPDSADGRVFQIEIEKITPNPDQPRRNFDEAALRDLANSIREFGFIQPLVVSKVEQETDMGIDVRYQLIAGERRYMAAKMLGLRSVPAIVRNVNLEREKLELAVIENIQRENLNPIETARAFQKLQEEFRMTQREIAVKLGKSRETVANTVRLLDLPEYIRETVETGTLSESHARLLLGVSDPGAQKRLFDDILQNRLTTRDVKDRVEDIGGKRRRGRPPLSEQHLSPEMKMAERDLSETLGAPVEIRKGTANGKIMITFYSEEELEGILRRLGKE